MKALQVSRLQKRVERWIRPLILQDILTDPYSPEVLENAAIACVMKCDEELNELTKDPLSAEEAADVVICMLSHATFVGYDLISEVHKKMDINERRRWSGPDGNGIIHHVE